MQRVAFIGSRNLDEIPPEGVDLFIAAAKICRAKNYLLCTGAAKGADQLAAESCLVSGGTVQLYLPWPKYEQDWIESMAASYGDRVQVTAEISQDGYNSVKEFHPSSTVLTQGTVKLHARNYEIVKDCKSVIAIPRPPEQGGTAQGMRIARSLGIPVINLSVEEGQLLMRRLLSQ